MDLPELSNQPTRYPPSCASLSIPLLHFLHKTLPAPPSLILSIGSGPGLLEALFLQHFPSRSSSFFGVEVSVPEGKPPVNRFLPEQNALTVNGTWAVLSEEDTEELNDAEPAKGLLFVYPRQPGLIKEYLHKAATEVEVVVWIGPRCDEGVFKGVLEAWGDRDHEGGGQGGQMAVEEGEMVAVYRRKGRQGDMNLGS
ncbi:hypothetical protein QBC35DRAFT_473718 [Podospora australis]|uniref:Uncharacterized protein n=1 Tax=Podospora australis TaxID=1536484 RepID=A0AAN6WV85_9PEZI|nr:hypothetical protein QBC35DRAFT_473718 [Podospora australis]